MKTGHIYGAIQNNPSLTEKEKSLRKLEIKARLF